MTLRKMAFDELPTPVEQSHDVTAGGSVACVAPFVACAQMSACRGESGVDKCSIKPQETLLE
ncbi:hypothetical protein GCM10009076_09240 [Erythrobacter ramosus]